MASERIRIAALPSPGYFQVSNINRFKNVYLVFKGIVKDYMIKLGLFFEVLGFLMMFWHSVWRPFHNIEDGSGAVFNYIPSKKLRHWIIDRFLGIAFLLMGIGVILLLI